MTSANGSRQATSALRDPNPTAREREIAQLLRDYRAFHTAFGGAGEANLEAMGEYGPAGIIFTGQYFDRRIRNALRDTYIWVDRLLGLLKVDDFDAWCSLTKPYLGDPADPSVLAHWHAHGRREDIHLHDRAIKRLAGWADEMDLELFVIFPKMLTPEESERQDARDARLYHTYHAFRVSRMRHSEAVLATARNYGCPTDRVERAIEFRRNVTEDECAEPGCERAPFAGGMCERHYRKHLRRRHKIEQMAAKNTDP